MQYLIMPFAKQMMLCGYKTKEYRNYWGYDHYGIDVSTIQGGAGDDPTVYASGDGVVLAAGKDDKLGYGVAICYNDVYNHNTKSVQSLVGRYMHMRSMSVKEGDVVKAGTPIGVEGKEGTGDYHLHLEFDTDCTPKYATWTPQVAGSNFWKKGIDTTVNPSFVLHVGEQQTIVDPTYNPAWLNAEDFAIPKAPKTDKPCESCVAKDKEISALQEEIDVLKTRMDKIKTRAAEIIEICD